MIDDETTRHKIAGELMGRLAGTGAFKVTSLEGERPFMVAFDGERISDVFARIAWTGGYSNLAVVGDGGTVLLFVLPSESAVDEESGAPLTAAEIHRDASIGMLVALAREYEDGLRIPVRLDAARGDVLAGAELIPA